MVWFIGNYTGGQLDCDNLRKSLMKVPERVWARWIYESP